MGSLGESDQISVDLELEPATTGNGDKSIVHPTLTHDESIQPGASKRLLSFTSCSSSMSSDSSLQDLDIEHDKASVKLEVDDQLATEHDEKLDEQPVASGTPSSSSSPSTNDSISESPPIQVMDRSETPEYRIPSHAFARKKSTTPGDWSMASNESLFSINMGGASFCNQDSFFFRSGELDLDYGAEASISSPLFDLPYDSQFVDGKITEAGKSNELGGEDKTHELGEVNNEGSSVLDEPVSSNNKEDRQSTAEGRPSHFSSSSSKSFVFPILAGETEKGNSPNPHGLSMGSSEEPKLGSVQQSSPKPEPAPEPTSEAKTETKNATPPVGWTKWFPCFRYCACCS